MNKKVWHPFLFIAVILGTSVCTTAQVATIDAANKKQYIDGFGASTAWHGQISDAEADAAFKNNNSNQLGLSILRVRIDPNSLWTDEKVNAQKAKARGAMILATPWTPPASMKTNNNVVAGGLKTTSYADYATFLKNFCNNMGNIDVISVQNEPNISVTYESCTWNATQLMNFCKNNAPTIGKPVMMPEAYNFDSRLSDSTLNDSTAASHITHIGGHLYGTTPWTYTKAINAGKRVWMTEHYYTNEDIGTCITMAREILDCMYNNMNAYIWWYLRQPGCNIINTGGSIKKKGYTMAQFSKYIRPGYYRIDATYQPQSGVFVVGFKGGGNDIVLVVNSIAASKIQTFTFKNDTIYGVRKYVTSGSKNIMDEGVIVCSNNSFKDTLDAQSITTYVSQCAQIQVIPYLQVNNGALIDTDKITFNLGDSIILAPKANGGYGSWSWSGCGTSGSSDKQTIHPDSLCTSIVATFTNSCGVKAVLQYAVTLNQNVDVKRVELPSNIMVSQNPAADYIQLSSVAGVSNVQIWNLVGQQVMSVRFPKSPIINISSLKSGIYLITINLNGREIRYKFLKK